MEKTTVKKEALKATTAKKPAPKAPTANKVTTVKKAQASGSSTAALDKSVYDFVAKNPGCRGEAVSTALKADPKRVGYVLRKLRDSKHLTGKGTTRAMVYKTTAKALA